jgi:hypothetical protein
MTFKTEELAVHATRHRPARIRHRTVSALFAALLVAAMVGLASTSPTAAEEDPAPVLPEGTVAVAVYDGSYSCCLSGEVSYNPVSGRTLAVWIAKDGPGDRGHIMAALVEPGDPVATVGTPVRVSVEEPATGWYTGHPATVTPTPEGGWLVIYEDRDRTVADTGLEISPVYGQFLDSDGQRIGTNLVLSSDSYNYTGGRRMVAYVAHWSPEDERYLLTWSVGIRAANDIFDDLPADAQNKNQFVGRFLSATGVGIGDDFPVTQLDIGTFRHMDMARGKDRWVVVGHAGFNTIVNPTIVQVVDKDGPVGTPVIVSDPEPPAESAGSYAGTIAYNAAVDEFLVLYRDGIDKKLWMRRLDGAGAPIGAGPTEIPGVPTEFGARIDPAGPNGYLVAVHTDWGNDVVTFQLDTAGVLVDGSLETVASSAPVPDANFLSSNFRPSVAYVPGVGAAITWWGITNDEPKTTGLYLRFVDVTEEEEEEEQEDGGAGGSGASSGSGSWVPSSGGAPEQSAGDGEWQREDGTVVPLVVSSPGAGQVRYSTDGLQVTLTGGAGSSASRGLVADADGGIVCEVCATLASGGVVEAWMFSTPRLVAAHAVDGLPCQTFVIPVGSPLDGGGPVGAGAHTLQLALPTAGGMQAVNVGVTVGGPVPASVPAGDAPVVPTGPLLAMVGLALAGAGVLVRGRTVGARG